MQASESEFEGEALRCWSASLRILSRSDKSTQQVRVNLIQKNFAVDQIEAVIERLLALDYLNDQRYASAYVRTHGSRLGNGQLRRKLLDRGIPEAMIEAALDENAEPDQLALALQIAERRYQAIAGLPRQTVERRISSLLLRRGFTSSTVWSAIRELQQRN